jgi:hypothetical protein
MTTERRPLSGLEWRLLLTTGLAGTYLLSWVAMQKTLPAGTPAHQEVAAAAETRPVAMRPPRAVTPRPPRAASPKPRPPARSRPPRVRTRSS